MKYFIANWKMYAGKSEAITFARVMSASAESISGDTQLIACPSFVHIEAAGAALSGTGVCLGAQNAYFEVAGAFTGEISAAQLKELGVSYILAGHSERRRLCAETDELVGKKIRAIIAEEMSPVLCVGETVEERESGQTLKRVGEQIRAALKMSVGTAPLTTASHNILIAYEPVWAIGTGFTPSAEEAGLAHAHIKRIAHDEFGIACPVLYGGSITPDNLDVFWNAPDVDGVLVGGASARADQLTSMLEILAK